jgi:hypothetical protein
MAVLRIKGFAGAIPVTGDRELPDNAAVDSFNTWLYGKELRGVRPPTHLLNINLGMRKVFRVPKRNPGVAPSDLNPSESVWVQFADHDTDIVKGQLVEDKYERYYFCSPTIGPRFNTYARLLTASPHYKLGVPGPVNTVDTAGNNPNKPTITQITSQKVSDELQEVDFKISVGATGATSYANSGGTGNRTALIAVTATNVANPTYLVDGNTANVGCKFTDLTAAASQVTFDFSTARIIDEFTWKQKGNNTYGTWVIAGYNSAWVDLGGAILGGNPNQPYRFTNATAYRYYRLQMEPASNVTFTTCAYVYTWVNEYGEESAPSLPVLGAGDANGVWYIGNITDPPANPPTSGTSLYTKKRLYRTLSGGEGNFYLVSEHLMSAALPDGNWPTHTSYIDDHQALPDTTLAAKLPLESTFWVPPPDTLQGWIAMPNGFLVAFDKAVETPPGSGRYVGGNTVYMSDAYHFHAWPVAFKYATETQIVGLGVIGQTCVGVHAGYPATVTGSKPATCPSPEATTGGSRAWRAAQSCRRRRASSMRHRTARCRSALTASPTSPSRSSPATSG